MNNNYFYKRQIILTEIGEAGQNKITNASVLCIGVGGLGCPALLYLVAAGVGRIGIVDFDIVDETNLQRQILFTIDQIGQNKTVAARKRLHALNPNVEIQIYDEELTDKNVLNLFDQYDIIIDGTDNFATKFLINDAAVKSGKPFIYGSISGFDGQVSIFNYHGGSCYRCLFPEAPKSYIPNCAEAGIIGAVAGIVGTVQAMEAIKIIVNHKSFKPLTSKLWNIDMHNMKNAILSIPKNPHCSICSKPKEQIILKYSSQTCDIVAAITPEESIKNNTAIMIDVRELEEWNAGHIDKAEHIALSALIRGRKPDFSTESEIIVYCQKGLRGKQAVSILQKLGYTNAKNITGGYEALLNKKCN